MNWVYGKMPKETGFCASTDLLACRFQSPKQDDVFSIMIKDEKLQRIIAVLRPLSAQLPKGLRADWRGTNHYELHSPYDEAGGYWWLDWFDCLDPKIINENTEDGQRAGLLLDLAEAVSKLRDEGLLQIEPMDILR